MQPLHPFEPKPWLSGIALGGEARWSHGHLHLAFALKAPEDAVLRPKPSARILRRDGLWQTTCFEAFLALPGQEGYWELNLSPNGDWNAYALTGYRQNLTAALEISALPYTLRVIREELHIGFQLDLRNLLDPAAPLELSLTAVLEHQGNGCSYWAWQHRREKADFHQRASFQLLLPSS